MKAWSSNYAAVKKSCCMIMPHHTISQVSPRLWGFQGLLPGPSTYPQGSSTVMRMCYQHAGELRKEQQGLGNKILLLLKKKKAF